MTCCRRTLQMVGLICYLTACTLSPTPTLEVVSQPASTAIPTVIEFSQPSADSHTLIQPADLRYIGAFRLPGDDERPKTFAYGGNAMTFNPNGDASGPDDGFPGSLFITGHDRLAYGELPDGSQVAEVSIPIPINADAPINLPSADYIQDFQNVVKGYFKGLDEIPRIGLAYLDTPSTGPKIHISWGQHMPPEMPAASHAIFDTNLSEPNLQGTWTIGNQSTNSTNGYLFTIPPSWAADYTEGKLLATGRFRDGGWSGMGPSLFAYRPWVDEGGNFAASGTHLEETVLLLYKSSLDPDKIEGALQGYQHPDEWEGGTWLTSGNGTSAVLFAGTKGTGDKYWYGYVNLSNPGQPCVDGAFVGEFPVCRLADGTPCPVKDLVECPRHNDYRGWWSSRFDAQLIFFNPRDMARVATGEITSWEPQPYAVLDIDEVLFLNPAGVEADMLGIGNQRIMRVGPVAYDQDSQLLYLLEPFADEAKPVIHVWRIETQ